MSQDPPIPRQDNRADQDPRSEATPPDGSQPDGQPPDGVATVEWGETEPTPRRTRWLTGIGQDHRLVPVVAGLGVAGVIASLLGEWSVTTVPNAGPEGQAVRVPAGVADVVNFGAGYLIGLLGVVGAVALVLFGAPTIRHNARVLGLALSGGLLVLLVGATVALEDGADRLLFSPEDGLQIEYGRGLTMAYLGTAGLGLALLLAGRFVRPPAGATGSSPRLASESSAGPVDQSHSDPAHSDPAPSDPADWPWRRSAPDGGRGSGRDQRLSHDLPPPTDLTVGPAAPFARPEQQDGR